MLKILFIFNILALFWGVAVGGEADRSFHVTKSNPHAVLMLNKGISAMEMRLRMIEGAKKSIDMEYFIFNTDKAGFLITQALIRRAQEGVRVRLLLDHFLVAEQITPFHFEELKRYGIQIRFYNTLPLIHVSKAQYRNHRKSFIVDQTRAIVGGRNIADEYFDMGESYNFLDRDIYVEGEIVQNMAQSFQKLWSSYPTDVVERPPIPKKSDLRYQRAGRSQAHRKYSDWIRDRRHWKLQVKNARRFGQIDPNYPRLRQRVAELAQLTLPYETKAVCRNISFVADKAGIGVHGKTEARVLKYELFKRMRAVNSKLIIDSPYFIVEKDTADILEFLLDEKKAQVKLLTNGLYSTDAFYVASVFNDIIGKWLDKGIEAHIYSGDVMPEYPTLSKEISEARWGTHSKSFVFDNDSIFIGSYNFDPRSNYYSTELGIFCDGNIELAEALKKNINSRIDNGMHLKTVADVNKYKFDRVGFIKRLGYYLFKIPAHLFDHLL